MSTKNKAILLLIIGVILLIIAPFIITRPISSISFGQTGQIGDTIGGITAPISSIIGSALVYLALKAQIDANKLIQDQIADQKRDEKYRKLNLYVSDQVEFVRREINNVFYNAKRTKGKESERIEFRGTSAINETLLICGKVNQNHFERNLLIEFPNLTKIRLLLEKCESIIKFIEDSELNQEDRTYLNESIKFVYELKLQPYLVFHQDKRMSQSPPCENCGEKHDGIPEEIYTVFDRINDKLS
jgi:hypothetical protein